jgi:hypothetical protein
MTIHAATRAMRLLTITAIETLARGLFPNVSPLSFGDRSLIIAACLKIGQLYPTRNDSDENFARYEQALAELASHMTVTRVLALATFRGVRDPSDLTPGAEWLHTWTSNLRWLRRNVPSYRTLDDAHRKQAAYIRSGHLAIMERASSVSLLGDLGQAIHALADQRDEALRAAEQLANANRETIVERDELRAKLAAALPGPVEENVEPETLDEDELAKLVPRDSLQHVGAELREKWKREEEGGDSPIVAHDDPYAAEGKPN